MLEKSPFARALTSIPEVVGVTGAAGVGDVFESAEVLFSTGFSVWLGTLWSLDVWGVEEDVTELEAELCLADGLVEDLIELLILELWEVELLASVEGLELQAASRKAEHKAVAVNKISLLRFIIESPCQFIINLLLDSRDVGLHRGHLTPLKYIL